MSEKEKLCELCEEKTAVVLCPGCFKCYCSECSKFIHGIPSKRHATEDIPQGVRVDAMCPIHKKDALELFSVDEVKLCCFGCKDEKVRKKHNIVSLSEISQDNKIFSAENVKKDFELVLERDNSLEDKITHEIEKIQNEGNEMENRIVNTFKEAHEKLDAEEVEVKKELEQICRRYSDRLEKILEKIKEIREYNTALNEADKNLQGQYSRLMELNIVSEMEKQRLAFEDMHKMKMAGLNIDWDPDSRKLSFMQYIFNGAPIPNEVEFPVILCKSFDLAWECDESDLNEEEKGKVKYVVEIRKSGFNESWSKVYSGRDKKCVVTDVEMGVEYDVRVKCCIGDLHGIWSDIVNVKTKQTLFKTTNMLITSTILSQEGDESTLADTLSKWLNSDNFELLYRGTVDSFGSNDFHKLCDDHGNTLVLVKNIKGHIFGGFASVPWTSNNGYKQAPGSFLFTLTNMHGTEPTMFHLKDEYDKNAVYHNNGQGPCFGNGGDMSISSNCSTNGNSYSCFPSTYNDTTGKGYSIFTSNTSSKYFQVQEIEVFKIVWNE